MFVIQSSFAELIRQKYVILERILQREGGTVAIRPSKEDMTYTMFWPCFGDDNRLIKSSERYTTPM